MYKGLFDSRTVLKQRVTPERRFIRLKERLLVFPPVFSNFFDCILSTEIVSLKWHSRRRVEVLSSRNCRKYCLLLLNKTTWSL